MKVLEQLVLAVHFAGRNSTRVARTGPSNTTARRSWGCVIIATGGLKFSSSLLELRDRQF